MLRKNWILNGPIEYRELLNSVKQVAQKQKITSSSMEDRDIVAMARMRRMRWYRCSSSAKAS